MAHLLAGKRKLVARVRRLRGQLEGVERALNADTACGEVLRQLASIRGAMNGLTAELIEGHLREHVLEAKTARDRGDADLELVEVVRRYMK